MHLKDHEKSCMLLLGNKCTKVHVFLDQYFKYFRSEAHRVVLHHRRGAEKIGNMFAKEYGYNLAYRAAVLHIEDDLGEVQDNWKDLLPYILFLDDKEEEAAKYFLQLEFPIDEIDFKGNIYY